MPVEVIMPKLSMTMEEGTLLRWLKAEGDAVTKGEPLFEVMTDKINIEVEAPADGILRGIRCGEGETRPVLTVIAYIVQPGEELPAASEAPAHPGGAGKLSVSASGPDATLRLPVRAAPAVRRLARQLGVDLATIKGSGPHGRVRIEDVLAATASRSEAAPVAAATASVTGRGAEPALMSVERPSPAAGLTGVRRIIAERLSAVWQVAPHVTLNVTVDMGEAQEVYRRLATDVQPAGRKLSWTGFIAFAAVRALRDYPKLNATLEPAGLREHPEVHLGVAVDRPEGLVVPVVRNAGRMSMLELSDAIADVALRARSGKLAPDELEGGTFTVTNIGMFGVESFTPILNPPQVAILGVNAIEDRVVAHRGEAAVRPVLCLSLTIDHRALDGAEGARYLKRLRELLEVPWRLLL